MAGTQVKRANSGTVGKKYKNLDEQLLAHAGQGMSGEEIGEAAGIPAAQAMTRIRQILSDRDWLTEIEVQKLNILDLRKAKARIMDRIDKSYFDVDDMKEFIRATELMDRMLEKATKITDEQLSVVSGAQARTLVKLMTYAYDRANALLEEKYPGVDIAEIRDAFNDGLREGVRVIEAAQDV
jgi:hypothetical protein